VNCDDVRESAAVALLTRNPLDAEVQVHLDSCPDCRVELASLIPLPSLLSILDAGDLEAAEAASTAGSSLLDRLLAAAASERRRHRSRVLAMAAAVVLFLALPVGVWGASQLRDRPSQVAGQSSVAIDRTAKDTSTGITGRAEVWKAAWGSDLTVSITGVASGTRCTVVVVTKDGRTETAATWQASYAGTAQVRGTVAAPVGSILRIDIIDDSGRVLLRI
jgi:hypothetical protein